MASAVSKKTPIGTFRWFKLLEPAPSFEGEDDLIYSTDFLLPADSQTTFEFLALIDDMIEEMLDGDRKSNNYCPYKKDDKEEGMIRVRFKAKQLHKRDCSPAPGPIVVDSKKTPWPADLEVGNGSKGVVVFKAFKWKGKTGAGVSLIPTAVMVVEHVPYVRQNGLDLLDELEGFVVDDAVAAL